MNENVIPQIVLDDLKSKDVTKKDLIATCPIDLSFDCEYIKGFLLLTKEYLVVVKSDPIDNMVHNFRGVKEQKKTVVDDYMLRYDYQLLPVSEITRIHIERMLATNIIYVEHNDVKQKIAAFTNLNLEQMIDFRKTFKKLKEDPSQEEITLEVDKDPVEEGLCCPVCGTPYPDVHRKICPKCMNKKSVFSRTLRYFFKYKARMIILIMTYLLAAGLNLLWPYLSGTVLFDKIFAKNDAFLKQFGLAGKFTAALLLLLFIMFMTKIVQEIVNIIQGSFTATIVADTVCDMKKDVFSSMGRLSINFFVSKQTGSLMTRILSDAERVTGFFIDGFPFIFIHGLTVLATFAVMFQLNFSMSLVACILLPLLVVMSIKLKPKLWSLNGRRHRAERALNSRVNDNLTGSRVVKAFGQQTAENERFEVTNERLKDAEIRIVKYNNRFTALYNFVQEVSNIWVWILGVILLMNTHDLEFGILITFVGYVGQLNGPMRFFSRVFQMWSESINSAQRMFEIIDSISEVAEKEDPVRLVNPQGKIDINHVTFGYDKSHKVLKDINIHIEPGEMLGIVGHSGAGKTTLVNLISRLYDTDEGEIFIDGINVKDVAFSDLRRNVAMVSQDTYIFMGTVAENIAYANPDASMDDIIKAAKLASAHDFIARMPDGYDTMIGASGKDLSGGEKQRISIARAVLANPKILILDEATASVDTQTEKAIQESLNYLIKGRTTLSIAHRLSTLRDAKRLVVIDNGRITEAGTHDELVKLGGTYFKLLELQTKSLALKGLE